jgi:hypothetical protein
MVCRVLDCDYVELSPVKRRQSNMDKSLDFPNALRREQLASLRAKHLFCCGPPSLLQLVPEPQRRNCARVPF